MDFRNPRLREQSLDEGPDHDRAQPLPQAAAIAQKLIDTENARVCFFFPPSVATFACDVRLNESDRLIGAEHKIGLDVRRFVNSG